MVYIDGEDQITSHLQKQLNIDSHLGEFASDKSLSTDAGPSSQSIQQSSSQRVRKRQTNTTIDALIGQANLVHARGKSKEAVSYLFEAIKQDPYNPRTYRQLSDVYSDLGQHERAFEFRLLSTLLDSKTTASHWDEIGEIAKGFGRMELAIASFAKAIRCDPSNWIYYEKRIQVLESSGDTELAMNTRLQAAQFINCQTSNVDFVWMDKLIKTAADYFCSLKDEERATETLETFILRSREFGRTFDSEHLALLNMWINKGRFEDSVKSILALHQSYIQAVNPNGCPALKIEFTNAGFTIDPFPPNSDCYWIIDDSFRTEFLSNSIICFIHLSEFKTAQSLAEKLLKRVAIPQKDNLFLDISRTFQHFECFNEALDFIEKLLKKSEFKENAEAWFICGRIYQITERIDNAKTAYESAIEYQPGHIDARINLSTILQQRGDADKALEMLRDFNLESCSQLPDERLLVRQAEVLLEQGRKEQYIRCLRMLLIPHFYVIHRLGEEATKLARRVAYQGSTFSAALKKCALDTIKGGPLEKVVKRLGYVAFVAHRITDDLSGNELHDYALKLAEGLFCFKKHEEMLHVICYAFLHPKIIEQGSQTFQNLLFFASIKSSNFSLAFEFLRYFVLHLLNQKSVNQTLLKRIHIAMNYVFANHQSVVFHKFIMRHLSKLPNNTDLRVISGNNSLVAGSYRHSLGEYLRVWLEDRTNPLLCLLIALTFSHISCKNDISSRHLVAMRAVAFMNKYLKYRGPCQETFFNIGRMLHQMGILPSAIYFYEKVLYQYPTPLISYEHPDTGETIVESAEKYDLKMSAAYNLSLIYMASANRGLARKILEQFCTV